MNRPVADPVAAARQWTTMLASEIGPRRPCSDAERRAAEALRDRLGAAGVPAPRLTTFRSRESFGSFHGPVLAAGAVAGIVSRRFPRAGALLSAGALAAGIDEARFGRLGESAVACRSKSRNLTAIIEPAGGAKRTLCLVSHLDSSRSGLMFHPSVTPYLGFLNGLAGASLGVQALDPLLRKFKPGRFAVGLARLVCGIGAALMLEREIRGEDVPGANDNASGAAVTGVLAAEIAAEPLESTRVVLLITGSEESGVLGMRSFLRTTDTSGWLFLNFDGVGGRAPLRYLVSEGDVFQNREADSGILRVMEGIAQGRPELGLSPVKLGSGLPYDSTPVLVGGGRAATFGVQDRSIPDYHAPTDTADRISDASLERALEAGRDVITAIDRGEADPAD
jgi:Peptidase family M28